MTKNNSIRKLPVSNRLIFRLSVFILLLSASSCQVYHDTTAHYNAYFLANEKVTLAENTLLGAVKDDYANLPDIFPKIDTNFAKTQAENLEYALEKASLAIQRHKRSKWTDDGYLLIGKIRFYQGDFRNAVITLKYVNTMSDDFNTRHAALTWLIRTYIELGEYKDAAFTAQYLAGTGVPVSPDNSRDFYLALAHFSRRTGNLEKSAEYLEKALPNISRKALKRRVLYLTAASFQELGQNDKAHGFYSELLSINPDYDMMFYAQLNASKTLNIRSGGPEQIKKTRKYLRDLAEDGKNAEFRDKIFYDLADFELRQGNADKALEYLDESLFSSQGNRAQLAKTYDLFGKVYYDLQNYERAAVYYDSALLLLPPDSPKYEQTKKRTELLDEFAGYFRAVKQADRLLMLYGADETGRRQFLEKEIETEKAEIDKHRKNAQKLAAARLRTAGTNPTTVVQKNKSSTWYFYNNEAVNYGKSYFFREWNNRALRDNWRRADSESGSTATMVEKIAELPKDEAVEKPAEDIYAGLKSLEDRLAEIPKNESGRLEQVLILEKNLFLLGKMYTEKMGEQHNAYNTLERFADDFPKSPNAPEALFLISKICEKIGSCDKAEVLARLQKEYPESLPAKISQNADFVQESNADNSAAGRAYEAAFARYEAGDLAAAAAGIAEIKTKFRGNRYSDKVRMLEAFIQAKKGEKAECILNLKRFKIDFPESELLPSAEKLLKKLEE